MAYLIGTDEAGYAPNLGPLVVTGTVWRVPDKVLKGDLYDHLADTVSATVDRDWPQRLVIADSKVLYQSAQGLGALDRGVLAALAACGQSSRRWRSFLTEMDPSNEAHLGSVPWFLNYDIDLPRAADGNEIDAVGQIFADALVARNVQLLKVRAVTVFPDRFNELVDGDGSKGTTLSRITLQLVRDLMEPLVDGPILVSCDKHGGRNKYQHLLQHLFPDHLVEVWQEGRDISIYRWGRRPLRIEVRFKVNGESFLPSALASMVSKYLRELAMEAFNSYWCCRVENLRPTAGYPSDAARFKAEIQAVQAQLGIGDHLLWRKR